MRDRLHLAGTRVQSTHRLRCTPLEFYKRHCAPFSIDDRLSLINDPRNPYSRLLTVAHLNNMAGSDAQPVLYVNTSSKRLIEVVKALIDADQSCWFGCDVGQYSNTQLGIMDTALYDFKVRHLCPCTMNGR